MIERIKQLEEQARALEPAREQITKDTITFAESHLKDIYTTKTYFDEDPGGQGFLDSPIQDTGVELEHLLQTVHREIDQSGINAGAHGHLGYIPGGGLYASALGDYLAAVTNNYAGVFFASPGAVRLENQLISWMADMVGYPDGYAGNLSSGGSIANLTAIVTARDAHDLRCEDIPKAVIYCTHQMHHCLLKAIRIAGLKEAHMREIPQDGQHRMIPDALQEQINHDRADGLKPWMVIASAGTTDVGAVDPLKEVGKIAKTAGCWYHIDAAYGGFFMLLDEMKSLFEGAAMSDSIVLDPHKGLFLPFGTGAVLVKNKQHLLDSHFYMANYLQDTHSADAELSPADLSPELTKHFRGLRMWLPLKLHGLAPFKAALAEKIELCRYFYHKIQEVPNMEVGPKPELSVCYFRYLPEHGDPNDFNQKLLQLIHKDGRVFMSSTTLDDKFLIRVAVLSFRTHLATIDLALDIIKSNLEKVIQADEVIS